MKIIPPNVFKICRKESVKFQARPTRNGCAYFKTDIRIATPCYYNLMSAFGIVVGVKRNNITRLLFRPL